MLRIASLALAAVLLTPVLALDAAAQSAPNNTGVSRTGRSPGPPLDRGPFTPEANRAFMGGGTVLEGAPGAPAPTPTPFPTTSSPAAPATRTR